MKRSLKSEPPTPSPSDRGTILEDTEPKKTKAASAEALDTTPVCLLIDHLCGRLVNGGFACYADKFYTWMTAFELVEVVTGNLMDTSYVPEGPDVTEESELRKLIPADYVPFRYSNLKSAVTSPVNEEPVMKTFGSQKDGTKRKPACVKALNATPVVILIDHICGRLVAGAYAGAADKLNTWTVAFDLVKFLNENLLNTRAFPQPPDGAEKAELRAFISESLQEDYEPFRCTSRNPAVEARLKADRELRARACQPRLEKIDWMVAKPTFPQKDAE